MQLNRGLVFWGLGLVTAGLVALAVQQGYVDRQALSGAWRLWPVVLIAIGLAIILSRTQFALVGTIVAALVVGAAGGLLFSIGPGFGACGDPASGGSLNTEEGAFTGDEASVELDFSCGRLEVGLTDGDGWQATAEESDGGEAAIDSTDSSLMVSSSTRRFMAREEHWRITLGSDVTYALSIDANAATGFLDLGTGRFTELTVDPNAGSLTLNLYGTSVEALDLSMNAGTATVLVDNETDVDGTLSTNAGSIELCAKPGTALRISVEENVAFSHDLESSDLVRSGDTWTSDGFQGADHHVDLQLEGNAASFSLNPEEGCA
jgi:hypothetical protein